MLVYDSHAYADSLIHIGENFLIQDANISIIKRAIPNNPQIYDAMSPWPYCTAPVHQYVNELKRQMACQGLVSYTSVLRPDHLVDFEFFERNGFLTQKLKDHFVYDPNLPKPNYSAKTRLNIRRGDRFWDVKKISLGQYKYDIVLMHEILASSKSFSQISHLTYSHFERLSEIEGVNVLGAFDEEGLGCALVFIQDDIDGEIHFHTIVGLKRAYEKNGFYALINHALEQWGDSYAIYLGGIPSSGNAAGIEKFKQRFSNRKTPVYMLKSIINNDVYHQLCRENGSDKYYFPSYR